MRLSYVYAFTNKCNAFCLSPLSLSRPPTQFMEGSTDKIGGVTVNTFRETGTLRYIQ